MKVIAKNPGEPFREMEVDNTLEALQAFVQGYIETVTLFTDMCIICNEEGAIKGLPYNITILGLPLCGPILLVGTDEDEFCDAPLSLEQWNSLVKWSNSNREEKA